MKLWDLSIPIWASLRFVDGDPFWCCSCFLSKLLMKRTFLVTAIATAAAWFYGCSTPKDKWEKSPGVEITVDRTYDNGKPYLQVFYENFGDDTIRKIRYQLITVTKGHVDTVIKEIDPVDLLRPKDRHVLPRAIGEDTLAADEVHAGKVWVVKEKK